MKKPDRFTAAIARELSQSLVSRSIDILHDYCDSALDSPYNLGHIASWFGEGYRTFTIRLYPRPSADLFLLLLTSLLVATVRFPSTERSKTHENTPL